MHACILYYWACTQNLNCVQQACVGPLINYLWWTSCTKKLITRWRWRNTHWLHFFTEWEHTGWAIYLHHAVLSIKIFCQVLLKQFQIHLCSSYFIPPLHGKRYHNYCFFNFTSPTPKVTFQESVDTEKEKILRSESHSSWNWYQYLCEDGSFRSSGCRSIPLMNFHFW